MISIHALREEGDIQPLILLNVLFLFLSTPSARRATEARRPRGREGRISIHALREEGDPPRLLLLRKMSLFLSTPSARRATHIVLHGVDNMTFLSTPSARRATWPRGTVADG